jgi:hypothetical protein
LDAKASEGLDVNGVANEELFESIDMKVRELELTLSSLRKQGKDPFIPSLMLKGLKPKILWAKKSLEDKDFEVINSEFEDIEKEIQDVKNETILNIANEIKEKISQDLSFENKLVPENKIVDSAQKAILEMVPEDNLAVLEQIPVEKVVVKKRNVPIVLADPKKFFFLRNGQGLKSIQDLLESLPSMSDEEFNFFTRNYDDDFSNWIQGVFFMDNLAKEIKGVKNKQSIIEILKKEVEN